MYCMYLFGTSKLCSSLTQFVWPHCVLLYVLCWLYIHKTYNTWSGDHLYVLYVSILVKGPLH